jgi:fido (protein-threonine AMPylation protein)
MDFDERPYQVEKTEYSSKYKLELWETAFGLQKTDGLVPSEYMVEQAQAHIDGKASYQEVEENVKTYYSSNRSDAQGRFEEADISSLRISQILAEEGFSLSPVTLMNYHKRLFYGIESFRYPVGKYRKENITKDEPVLNGGSVEYASYSMIADNLAYDFEMEKNRDYSEMSQHEIADKVMKFVSGIWQTHPFREGNTRTSAVFLIKYLRHMGFEVNNEPFKSNSKFFRDALVLDNAATTSSYRTDKYLKWFTDNLLFGGQHELLIVPFKSKKDF